MKAILAFTFSDNTRRAKVPNTAEAETERSVFFIPLKTQNTGGLIMQQPFQKA